ncbi:MAG: aconitase/3-isopropylmalate dehydratase large subunit family protein [Thermoleophilia bacterium]
MAQTFVEKVLAAHAGVDAVAPGEIVGARLDMVVSDELSFPEVVEHFRELGAERVFDPARVCVIADHESPARTIEAADRMVVTRAFCREQGIEHLVDVGQAGVMHVTLAERGLVAPGELILGYDSHMLTAGGAGALAVGVGATDAAVALAFGEAWLRVPETVRVTIEGTPPGWAGPKDVALLLCRQLGQDGCVYRAVEIDGSYPAALGMDGRFTLANMAIEVGAKTVAVRPDETTAAWLAGRVERDWQPVWSDPDAPVAAEHVVDVSGLDPLVALPHAPDLGVPVGEAGGDHVDQVFIGTCTNGRLDDLRVAASVLRGRTVHPRTRLLVVPASPEIFKAALAEGLIATFLEAGAVVGPPGCGPCAGLHMGVLADGEVGIATSSRNFPGRMGSRDSRLLVAGPAVAAASAVAGRVASPEEIAGPAPADGAS